MPTARALAAHRLMTSRVFLLIDGDDAPILCRWTIQPRYAFRDATFATIPPCAETPRIGTYDPRGRVFTIPSLRSSMPLDRLADMGDDVAVVAGRIEVDHGQTGITAFG